VTSDRGTSLLELLLMLTIALLVLSATTMATGAVREEGRVRGAATVLAGQFRHARQDAVRRSASTALVFDQESSGWSVRTCHDGNRNGVRRSDIAAGVDLCERATGISAAFPGVTMGVDERIPGPDDDAPSGDPVRLGRGNLASFSPDGTCTSGTIFLRSAGRVFYAVRLAGVTGRTRLLRYDTGLGRWQDA
jgi:hypothetical protein